MSLIELADANRSDSDFFEGGSDFLESDSDFFERCSHFLACQVSVPFVIPGDARVCVCVCVWMLVCVWVYLNDFFLHTQGFMSL
jgi:hypothetical protein